MNIVMMPMWLLSGVFFASSNFPDVAQPFIRLLLRRRWSTRCAACSWTATGPPRSAARSPRWTIYTVGTFGLSVKLFRCAELVKWGRRLRAARTRRPRAAATAGTRTGPARPTARFSPARLASWRCATARLTASSTPSPVLNSVTPALHVKPRRCSWPSNVNA